MWSQAVRLLSRCIGDVPKTLRSNILSIYICKYTYTYIYIRIHNAYIYIDREREREATTSPLNHHGEWQDMRPRASNSRRIQSSKILESCESRQAEVLTVLTFLTKQAAGPSTPAKKIPKGYMVTTESLITTSPSRAILDTCTQAVS